MKNLAVIFFLAIIICSCRGVNGSGNIKTEHRDVNQFDGVETSGSVDVDIKNGNTAGVEVEADDNVLPYIVTEVHDGILNVHYKSGMYFNNTHAKVYITASTLSKLHSSGSADINAIDGIKNDGDIDIRVAGSGNINAVLDAPTITASASGSGNLVLKGKTRNFNCQVSGSGDVKCKDLLSENTTVRVSGSGTAQVYASVSLKADAAGSGDIRYSGNPQNPNIHTSGSRSVAPSH